MTSKHLNLPVPPSSSAISFVVLSGGDVSDELLNNFAKLFSANYGVWNDLAGPSLSGKRVKMNGSKLKKQCASPQSAVLATCFKDADLVGHAFATVWEYDGGTVGWVTQLVVDTSVRRRYVATQLLQTLKGHKLFQGISAIGLASSHPAAVAALSKYSHVQLNNINSNFILQNAAKILDSSPIDYIKRATPRGSLFEENNTTGAVSCAFTEFYVDHQEPLEALAIFKRSGRWCLGELLEGHEFLIILPVV